MATNVAAARRGESCSPVHGTPRSRRSSPSSAQAACAARQPRCRRPSSGDVGSASARSGRTAKARSSSTPATRPVTGSRVDFDACLAPTGAPTARGTTSGAVVDVTLALADRPVRIGRCRYLCVRRVRVRRVGGLSVGPRRRLEPQPPGVVEVQLRPRVCVGGRHDVVVARLRTWCKSDDHSGRDAFEASHERHRRGELFAVAAAIVARTSRARSRCCPS